MTENTSAATIKTQTSNQTDEASPPRRLSAYQKLLRVAGMLEKAGEDVAGQGHTVEGLKYCERAAWAEFGAALLDELGVISLTLVGAQGEGAPGEAR